MFCRVVNCLITLSSNLGGILAYNIDAWISYTPVPSIMLFPVILKVIMSFGKLKFPNKLYMCQLLNFTSLIIYSYPQCSLITILFIHYLAINLCNLH
jgi:hypothetical protein